MSGSNLNDVLHVEEDILWYLSHLEVFVERTIELRGCSQESLAINVPIFKEPLVSLRIFPAKLVKKLEAEGKTTEGYVLYTYAAIQAWAQAVEKAGSTDFDKVRMALNDGEFDTVLGKLSFDGKGDVSLPGYVFYEWKDGKYDYLDN